MTIGDIAKAANVSASTVSKVLNKKDASIKSETRERILRLVKEYHYTPYAKQRSAGQNATLLLGVMVDPAGAGGSLLPELIRAVRAEGYSPIVCAPAGEKEERDSLSVLQSHRVDGIIWQRLPGSPQSTRDDLDAMGIPYVLMDETSKPGADNIGFDCGRIAYAATEILLQNNHRRVVCVTEETGKLSALFRAGFKNCLYDHGIALDAQMMRTAPTEENAQAWPHACTGAVCQSVRLAEMVIAHAKRFSLSVPEDLSVICAHTERRAADARVSALCLPGTEAAQRAVKALVDRVENRPGEAPSPLSYTLNHHKTIAPPNNQRARKIIVVGAINMDTLFYFDRLPELGETVTAHNRVTMPGGKGMNQALAAAKLEADVCLIGRVGKDYDGSLVCDYLKSGNVDTCGVTADAADSTGHAYIYIQADGESSIVIHDGANSALSAADIMQNEHLFEGASYCLLQTEIRPEVVLCAAQTARRHGVKVVLKPCTVTALSDELLQCVDILLPNRREINTLLPGDGGYEEKAKHFLDRGAACVIVTLGRRGCYLRDQARSRSFPAADVESVDTTGAADAFAATLAVYLSRGEALETAVEYANCAAGLSTTRQGVPPSLADRHTIELYMSKRNAQTNGRINV